MSLILSGTAGLSDVDGSAATPAIRGTDTNTGIFFPAADTIAFAEGGTETMRLDSAGNMGLGVTPSAWSSSGNLQIKGSGLDGGIASANQYLVIGANGYYNAGWKYITTGNATLYQQSTGQHQWYSAGSGSAGGAISYTQAMTLDASGNLGVGTTSPAYRLDVRDTNATVFSRGTGGYGAFYAQGSGTNSSYIFMGNATSGEQGRITCADTGILTFSNGSGATERARISSGGRFSIGTTSSQYPLYVNLSGDTGDWFARFQNNAASQPYGLFIQYSATAPNNTASDFIYCSDTSSLKFQVRSNGGIANYSGNNVNLSDRREKTNFAPAGDYLAKICAIPVQTFNYIDQNLEEDDGLTLGVVAQDVQAVAPELVMESNWAEKGEEPKMRLSIYQTDLQYALMKCIQEQQAIITQLQADVAALKGQA